MSSIKTDTETIVQQTQLAMEPVELEAGKVFLVMGADGEQKLVDTRPYSEFPSSVIAQRTARDVRSLLTYLEKHAIDGETEVYADPTTSSVVALIDAHAGAGKHAGNQRHSIALGLVKSEPWKKWAKFDGTEL